MELSSSFIATRQSSLVYRALTDRLVCLSICLYAYLKHEARCFLPTHSVKWQASISSQADLLVTCPTTFPSLAANLKVKLLDSTCVLHLAWKWLSEASYNPGV